MQKHVAFIRPATPADLDSFSSFAQESGPGITSLPRNLVYLERYLAQSERSFSTAIEGQVESYLFCLEFEGKVIGSSGLVSRKGMKEPFFAFHKLNEIYSSPTLNIECQLPVLHFIKARKKPTELGTLYLKKEFRGKGFAPLLSYCRFLFISLFKKRFASTVIAELRGVNHEGISPFWEAVGRHFFRFDFSEADQLRLTNPDSIRELFPRHPIYPILLPKDAQEAIGTPHSHTIPARRLLENQGFKQSDYFDIFDAGPHFYARTDEIKAVHESKRTRIKEMRSTLQSKIIAVVANTTIDFRACLSPIIIENGHIIFPVSIGQVLNVDVGDEIIYYKIP
jgi:arginine N-succinyltransferase